MKRLGRVRNPLFLLSACVVLAIFLLFNDRGLHAGTETRHELETSEEELDSIREKSPQREEPRKSTSEDLSRLQRRLGQLEIRYKDMAREVARLRNDLARLSSTYGSQEGGPRIGRVRRITGGRPSERDGMVSVAGMVATWQQLDLILDKLDEIATTLSQKSRN